MAHRTSGRAPCALLTSDKPGVSGRSEPSAIPSPPSKIVRSSAPLNTSNRAILQTPQDGPGVEH